jgi:hypothetical protein
MLSSDIFYLLDNICDCVCLLILNLPDFLDGKCTSVHTQT